MNEYSQAAEKFIPDKIEFLFIAESPPNINDGEKPRYFYFTEKTKADYLFKGVMDVLFPKEKDVDKSVLLEKFKNEGFFLIDASEEPINQKSKKERDKIINDNKEQLVSRLEKLKDKKIINKETRIILVKKNVYEILSNYLKNKRYNVINKEHLDFPSTGNQNKFRNKLKKILRNKEIISKC